MSFLRSAKERLVHIINTCQHSSTNVCHVPSYRLWQERISRSRGQSTYALLVVGVSFPSMGIGKYVTLTVCRRFPWRCKGLMHGHLNYLDCCPNQPEPGKAFCYSMNTAVKQRAKDRITNRAEEIQCLHFCKGLLCHGTYYLLYTYMVYGLQIGQRPCTSLQPTIVKVSTTYTFMITYTTSTILLKAQQTFCHAHSSIGQSVDDGEEDDATIFTTCNKDTGGEAETPAMD